MFVSRIVGALIDVLSTHQVVHANSGEFLSSIQNPGSLLSFCPRGCPSPGSEAAAALHFCFFSLVNSSALIRLLLLEGNQFPQETISLFRALPFLTYSYTWLASIALALTPNQGQYQKTSSASEERSECIPTLISTLSILNTVTRFYHQNLIPSIVFRPLALNCFPRSPPCPTGRDALQLRSFHHPRPPPSSRAIAAP